MQYIHQREDWAQFRWDTASLATALAQVRYKQGILLGRMKSFGFSLQTEASLEALTASISMSAAIEGEAFSKVQVRSSLARKLGVNIGGLTKTERNVEGFVDVMLDAVQNHTQALTKERLLGWHASLFPTGYSGLHKIHVAAWRTEASGSMQVVSGRIGHETVHFEAPSAQRIEKEMEDYLQWLNTENDIDPVIKSAIAHLYFLTIHPFEDGNGRIARTIADYVLAKSEETEQRYYSLTAQIEREKESYYQILEQTQKGDLDITAWLMWYISLFHHALDAAENIMAQVQRKADIWKKANMFTLNERQRTVINRLLDGFEGKLNNSKYAKLAKCSPDTALRDLKELVDFGIVQQGEGGGRSTHYVFCEVCDS